MSLVWNMTNCTFSIQFFLFNNSINNLCLSAGLAFQIWPAELMHTVFACGSLVLANGNNFFFFSTQFRFGFFNSRPLTPEIRPFRRTSPDDRRSQAAANIWQYCYWQRLERNTTRPLWQKYGKKKKTKRNEMK